MKKFLLLITTFLILFASLNATIFPSVTQNIIAMKGFMTAIDNLSSIPDNMFSEIPERARGTTGIAPQGPFAGDWMSETETTNVIAGKTYLRKFEQRRSSSTGNVVVTVYSNSTQGIMYFDQPEYCRSTVGAPGAGIMDATTTMSLTWDYDNSPVRAFKVNIHSLKPSDNIPVHQWIAVTKNGDTYQISSTMIFDNTFTYVDTANYNEGTVLFAAMVKDSDFKTMIYTDRANTATDSDINLSSVTDGPSGEDGPWPTPIYLDGTNPSPNTTEPAGWGGSKFSAQDKLDTLALPLKSHNKTKGGEL